MTKTRSLIAAALTLACAGAFAQSPAAVSVQRDFHPVQARIEQGPQHVSWNAREAARLRQQAADVRHLREQSLRDGRLSRDERAQLQVAQSRLSRDIAVGVRHGSLSRQEAARLERSITPVSFHETVNIPRHR